MSNTASSLRNELDQLSILPEQIIQLLEGLSTEQLTAKPTSEEFSFTEHICHLRDIEREGYAVRIKRLLTEPNPQLPDVDGARLAFERDYNRELIGDAVETFREARKADVVLLARLDAGTLARKGLLEGVGEITLRQLITMMLEHDASHLEEMVSLRRRLLRSASV